MNKEEGALKPTREMFVQYKHHSYWDCEFVPEMQVIIERLFQHCATAYAHTHTHLYMLEFNSVHA